MEIKITNEEAKIIFEEVASRYCTLEELTEDKTSMFNFGMRLEVEATMKVLDNFLLKLREKMYERK